MNTAENTRSGEWKNRYAGMLQDAANDWFSRQMREPWTKLYLTYTPSDGPEWGALHVVNELEHDGSEIVLRFSAGWTLDAARHKVREACGRLPLLPTEAPDL